MGSATRGALTALRDTLAQQGSAADLGVAEELFSLARLLGSSTQLRNTVADPTADASAKASLTQRVFGGKVSAATLSIVSAAVQQRWSQPEDLAEGLEEIGVRTIAQSAAAERLGDELFAVSAAVSSDAQLELALRSKLAGTDAKVGVVDRLLTGRVSAEAVAIVRQIVADPRGRSIREALRWAQQTIADQRDAVLAVVTSARPLTDAQTERLRAVFAARYGKAVAFNTTVDPSLIGGLRVRVGDDVIDSSIATRLSDVRLQLA
jgi:F-type H+-transporting ATPase subunit delta